MEDLPVDIGLIYEGERIRKSNMYVDLAGPKSKGAELLIVAPPEEVEDGKVEVIGPDIPDMEEGSKSPFGVFIKVSGKTLEEDLEGVFERRLHDFSNYVQGFMHLNSRDIIWCRVSKDSARKGLKLEHIGKALINLYKNQFDVIEKMQITYYTDEKAVDEHIARARKVYERRDDKAATLRDEDVDVFYGCLLCQSFAPTHVCAITPSRTSGCGAISWFEGRAASKVDPNGPIFEIPKGEEIDSLKGEFSGINEVVKDKSNGAVERVFLHSIFDYPHTSCGCFEAIAFYIPEVDGIGIVHRDFHGVTPFGIPFSTMAGQVGGGLQSQGFLGIGVAYLRSIKFLQADGGWERIVWMPSELKDRVKEVIPPEIYDKIATETDATELEGLQSFLKEKQHPVLERLGKEEQEEGTEEAEAPVATVPEISMPATAFQGMPVGVPGGEFTIIFKNAKIYAEKIIIKRKEKK
ncbi:MAG TPA: CO dehydrogenase/CO-methylating acetyl-CoA synthase complex subunit beta [Euryarchaeota archaeon]|nr:carbon monoxide dehydrogenase/acetyl-CoA synthase subunit alpha [archaeon BMS3Bbin15]HDL15928.1 CO dehydrogenase/CO-methylating acetyl-CoA synthase complex subunit beta [Euryarchaeota archaeon]